MLARMLDSAKPKPPTTTDGFGLSCPDGEPPPLDPQALAMRLRPRIPERIART
jgi:hypothetical protein